MKKITLLFISLFIGQVSLAQWTNLNSGINDELTDIVFFEDQGVVSGENGLYYSLTGGNGSANWQRFEITGNASDALLYANTTFASCYSDPNNTQTSFTVYAVGKEIVNNKAVIMSLEIPSLNYNITVIELSTDGLNDIKYSNNYDRYYAVGNNRLMLYFDTDISSYTVITNGGVNYNSISFNSTGFMSRISSENNYLMMTTSGHQITEVDTPDETHNDMTYATYSVNDKYMRHNYTTKYVYSNYDYGPINGNTIFEYSGRNFVGTDHGIFMSNTAKNVLQWQPSSGNINTNAFWSSSSSSIMYACGSNGTILKSVSPTEEAKPFARVDFDGGCLSENSFNIAGITGDSTTCSWYIDDVFVSSECESFNYTFSSNGIYDIKLVVDYNGLITEHTKTVHIVEDPEIDKPITILDSILCHEEPVQIEISNSEPDVFYTLHKGSSSAVYGTSAIGNGGTIVLNSAPLNETANYHLKSANINAPNCKKTFTETFEIIVEQTTSNFYVGLINAATNEDVTFHQTSEEASSFSWAFTTDANILTSTEENPTNSFNTTGIHDVTLTASSANLCVDDITVDSPNIYTSPSENTECWSYINDSQSTSGGSSFTEDISHISDVTGGYLTGGNYRNEIFGTNQGIEFQTDDVSGAFLTKHDNYGALKWLVYTTGINAGTVYASVEDHNGDIYLANSGNGNNKYFYDNSGKSVRLNNGGGNIIKLNANGELIWYMSIRTYTPTGLTIDNNNDLIVYGSYDIYNDTYHTVYLNDELVDEIGTIIFPDSGGTRGCYGIMKITPEGSILWDNEIFATTGSSGTGTLVRNIGVDVNNNYYIEGQYKNYMYIYHTGSTESTDLDYIQYNASGSYYWHLLKLDSNGALQWTNRSYATENELEKSIINNDAKTDADGNTYITGYSNYGGAQFEHFHNVENADGSTFSTDEAQTYFLKKINADGMTEWILGTEEESTSATFYPKGFQLEVKNNVITTIGGIKSNITTPEDVIFKSINDDNIMAPLTSTDLFINSYTTDGVLNKVSVFNSIIDNTVYSRFSGITTKGIGNYYVSSNQGLSADRNGRINFLNTDFCGNSYDEVLSVEGFQNKIRVSVVPNPNNGEFKLNLGQPYSKCKVTLYNTLGQRVSEEEFLNNADIPLKIIGETGIYFAEISIDDNYKNTLKVIVK